MARSASVASTPPWQMPRELVCFSLIRRAHGKRAALLALVKRPDQRVERAGARDLAETARRFAAHLAFFMTSSSALRAERDRVVDHLAVDLHRGLAARFGRP